MISHLPPLPDSPVARLFSRRHFKLVGEDAVWLSLPGGQTLMNAGEAADMVYILRTGRLGVFRHDPNATDPEDKAPQFVGVIRPGEPIGEMAMISGMRHSATVKAMRDSELLALPRRAFMRLIRSDPQLMADISRLMVYRLRTSGRHIKSSEPNVYALVSLKKGLVMRDLAETIATAIKKMGYSVKVVDQSAASQPTEWYSTVEAQHDYTLFCAEASDGSWISQCLRQSDRALLFGQGGSPAPQFADLKFNTPLVRQGFFDVILVHPEMTRMPSGGRAWFDSTLPHRLMHIIDKRPADIARLARTITGHSVGVVLSGGGARAYAHLGAIRAMRESHVPIDFVGGTSMGAIVAASVAMGWNDEEIEDRLRLAFVDSNPLSDITFPILSLTKGQKVEERLKAHFGDIDIADLWRPYFCLSSNLTSGSPMVHRNDRLRDALRASLAIPGLLPPVVMNDQVLVDGAVMKNFPADVMRQFHGGVVVGVDVTRAKGVQPKDLQGPDNLVSWMMSGQTHKGLPIASILMRAATVRNHKDMASRADNVDVLILPPLENIEIRDWKAFDEATQAGYHFTVHALQQLECAVTHVARKPTDQISGFGL